MAGHIAGLVYALYERYTEEQLREVLEDLRPHLITGRATSDLYAAVSEALEERDFHLPAETG